MPCTERAVRYLADSKVVFGPAKAANAGESGWGLGHVVNRGMLPGHGCVVQAHAYCSGACKHVPRCP